MTRASLLQIIDHVSAISDAEIRELEQLAAAFPYCQTAHVLLAKAAHDQGSMLAGQRLRRAATYAADRQLLRQLIEQPTFSLATEPAPNLFVPVTEPEPESAAVLEEESAAAAPAELGLAADSSLAPEPAPEEPVAEEFQKPVPAAIVLDIDFQSDTPINEATTPAEAPILPENSEAKEPGETEFATAHEAPLAAAEPTIAPEESGSDTAVAAPEADAEEAPVAVDDSSEQALTEPNPAGSAPDNQLPETEPTQEPSEEVAVAADNTEAEVSDLADEDQQELEAPNASISQLLITADDTPSEPRQPALDHSAALTDQPGSPADDDVLPPVAPPIRPPAEVGSSRFEFGLSLPDPVEQIVYQLPTLAEEPPAAETPTPPAAPGFRGDAHLGYALGLGSRLGYCLLAADELTYPLPADGFFVPDALLHEQAPQYLPAPPPAPSPFDLINKFLRNQPRLRTPAALPTTAEEQADLSVRSTQGVPDIASESLAKIMVRQGKVQKAIEIYERLMVRQPEKKAYFADQIQQLKSTE